MKKYMKKYGKRGFALLLAVILQPVSAFTIPEIP